MSWVSLTRTIIAKLQGCIGLKFFQDRRSSFRRLLSLASLLFTAFVLALTIHGCNLNSGSELQPLKVGITTWPGFDIVRYAQATGLFEKRGLKVEIVRFENNQDAARAALRGSLDATFASLWDAMQVDPQNDKPAFILVTNISHGADGIVSQGALKSVEDLRGKKVAAKLGTINHLILLEALNLHKVKPNDVQIEDISNESAAQLIEKGKLDGAVLWEPLLGETAKKSKGNIIYTTKEIDSLVIDGLMARSTVVQSKKAELTQLVLTWLDVMHALETKPDEVYAAVSKQLGQSKESFASDYSGLKRGDIEMQRRMFISPGRLQQVTAQLAQLLEEDPRHGRLPRKDLEINAELVTRAIEAWKA